MIGTAQSGNPPIFLWFIITLVILLEVIYLVLFF
jgi:hypothetical protein